MANNQKIVILEAIKNLVNNLPKQQFLRVHKSYIVAIDKVDALVGNTLEINGLSIPISKTYRAEVGEVFK